MTYNFDKITERTGTNSVKYDLRELIFKKPDVIPLWVADMDFETPDFIRDAVIKRAQHPIYGYSFRDEAYYHSIIQWIERLHGWKIEKDWMIFTPGIVPAVNFAVLAFTNPGDKIIVQPPVYFPFFTAVEKHNRILVHNQLLKTDNSYLIDFELLEKQAKDARMIILSNPHNPVGRAWKEDELLQVADICLRNDILIVSDEIHADLVLPGHRHTVMANLGDNIANSTITMHAASKTFNLAGLATSTVIIPNEEIRKTYLSFVQNLHVDMGNLFGKIATQAAFEHGKQWHQQMLAYVDQNVDLVCQFFSEKLPRIKVFRPEATYMIWIDFSDLGLTDESLKEKMIFEAGVGLNAGIDFGLGGSQFMRMNVACPKSTVIHALQKIDSVFHNL